MSLETWNKLSRPPERALKKIKAGRLSGMTDINPQWRLEIMTEVFGECGIGWKYEIEKLWTEKGSEDQIMAFAQIKIYIFSPEFNDWSSPIPGIGGSMMITKESKGLHTNDECYKMAVTDALSVAMKQLGVASDIYSGLWDGSKYRDSQSEKQNAPYKDEFYDDSKKDTKNDKRIDDIEQDDVKKGVSPQEKRLNEIEEKRKLWEKIKIYIENDSNPDVKAIYDVALKQYGVEKFSQMTIDQCKYTMEQVLDFVNPENIFDKE